MFGSFGWMELLLILFIVLIIFGAGKIPQLGEGLGKAIKGFKKSIHEPETSEVQESDLDQPQLSQKDEAVVPDESIKQNKSSSMSNQEQNISQQSEPVHKS